MGSNIQAKQEKLKEIQAQQEKLKVLQAELNRLNLKIEKNEKLTVEETKFFGELGWLSALAVTIASIAASL
jgi:flagellar motility protein MotE (MotC chaperone)